MLQVAEYENFVRKRITQLRHRLHVSEHKMSLDLGKSGSYMRSISIGKALPSMHEFLRICELPALPLIYSSAIIRGRSPCAASVCAVPTCAPQTARCNWAFSQRGKAREAGAHRQSRGHPAPALRLPQCTAGGRVHRPRFGRD